MNALNRFFSRFGLLLAALFLAACDTVPREPVMVPSHVQPYYGGPMARDGWHRQPEFETWQLPSGGTGFRPRVLPPVVSSGPPTRVAPWQQGAGRQDLPHPSVLSVKLATASQQLAIHCGQNTVQIRAAAEAAVTGIAGAAIGGAIGGSRGVITGAAVGATLGAAGANRRSEYDCQRVVDWHDQLLDQLGLVLKDQESRRAWCNYIEREGKTSRVCNELVIAPWRDGK